MATQLPIVPTEMENIHSDFRYSPGVRLGERLYIAGQVGRDKNLKVVQEKERQFVQAFENLGSVLATAGSSFRDVVEIVSYHTDMRDLRLFMKVKDQFFTSPPYPTWTSIGTTGLSGLAGTGLMLELKCTAWLGDDREAIVPPQMEEIHDNFKYSPAIRAGTILYVAGQVGRDAELRVIRNPAAQYRQAFENLRAVLKAAKTDFNEVVELVSYHGDMRDIFATMMETKDEYFDGPTPAAWTAVGTTALSGLAGTGLTLELKSTAVLGEEKSVVVPDGMTEIHQRFRYSPGVKCGDMLYIAGQVGRDSELRVIEDLEEQFHQAFANLGSVLHTAGRDYGDVIDMVSYHTDLRDLEAFVEVRKEYLREPPYPTWTAIGTTALTMQGLALELECRAAL